VVVRKSVDDTRLIPPNDHAGMRNVSAAGGTVVSRRYVGEPRFVALLLNETTWNNDFQWLSGLHGSLPRWGLDSCYFKGVLATFDRRWPGEGTDRGIHVGR